jgi:hypothetical protein
MLLSLHRFVSLSISLHNVTNVPKSSLPKFPCHCRNQDGLMAHAACVDGLRAIDVSYSGSSLTTCAQLHTLQRSWKKLALLCESILLLLCITALVYLLCRIVRQSRAT